MRFKQLLFTFQILAFAIGMVAVPSTTQAQTAKTPNILVIWGDG